MVRKIRRHAPSTVPYLRLKESALSPQERLNMKIAQAAIRSHSIMCHSKGKLKDCPSRQAHWKIARKLYA